MSRPLVTLTLILLTTLNVSPLSSQDFPQRDNPVYELYETEFDWLEIEDFGSRVEELRDNSYVGPFEIGFDFPFFGRVHQEFWLTPNGFIGFGNPAAFGSADNRDIPYARPPDNFIALYWKDFDPDAFWANGEVYYGIRDDKLVIQYQGFPERNEDGHSPENTITMQAVLEADGDVILQYRQVGDDFDLSDGTVGVEGPDGEAGLSLRFDGEGVEIAPETAYLISQYGPREILIWDAGTVTRSGTMQALALESMGFTISHFDAEEALPDNLEDHFAVFVNLGNFGDHGGNYHPLTDEEGNILAEYLLGGGSLYLEGSDTWYRDRAVEAHRYFNIRGERVGRSLEAPIVGIDGSFAEGLIFGDYRTQENNAVNHLRAENGAMGLFTHTQGEFEVLSMVANIGDGYRTVGSSFEYAGLVDGDEGTKFQLMTKIITFFQQPPPSFPAPYSLWGEADDSEVTLHWQYNAPRQLLDFEELDLRRRIASLAVLNNGRKPSNRVRRELIEMKRELRDITNSLNRRPVRDEFTLFNLFMGDDLYDRTNSTDYNILELENERAYQFSLTASYEDPDGESELVGPITVVPAAPLVPEIEIDFEEGNAGLNSVPAINGWEWGEPALGAASGTHAWGTGLNTPYQDNAESYLYTPIIDLNERQMVWLKFNHLIDCEADWDGGRVEISIDGGERWEVIEPRGGYPSDDIFSFGGGSGFTGTIQDWTQTVFDLSDFVGNNARVRFAFISDESNFRDQQGWFIDDLALMIPAIGSVQVVVERDNVRIRGARVSIDDDWAVAYTTEDGSPAFFPEIPAGEHTYHISKVGYVDSEEVRVLEADSDVTYEFELELYDSRLTLQFEELQVDLQPGESAEREVLLSNSGRMVTSYQIFIDDVPEDHVGREVDGLPQHGEPFELLQTFDLSGETQEHHFVGAQFIRFEYPESYRLVASAGGFDQEDPQLYHFNRAGTERAVVPQGSNGFGRLDDWGLRDLAYDGEFLYGSIDGRILSMDPISGDTLFRQGAISSPLQINRAITYVPVRQDIPDGDGAFWVGNSDDTWYKLNRDGEILDRVTDHGLERVAGMAWNPVDPDGAFLYIHDQLNEEGGAAIYRYNPETQELDEEPFLITAEEDEGIPGGAFVTHLYDTHNYTLGVVIQGVNGDVVKLYSLQPRNHWLTVQPNFSEEIEGEDSHGLILSFDTQSYIGEDLFARIEVFDPMSNEVAEMDVRMRVGGEWGIGVSGTVEVDEGDPDLIWGAVIHLGNQIVGPVGNEGVFTYSFAPVYPGEYRITAELMGYLPFESELFEVEQDGMVEQNIVFEHLPVGSLAGQVTSIEEQALEDAEIVAYTDVDGQVYSSFTEMDGSYLIEGIPEDVYTVEVLLEEWRADPVEAVEIIDAETTDLDFVMDDRLSVVGLRADGRFDDQVLLEWLPPGTNGEPVEFIYDDGELVNGVSLQSYEDILACRFVPDGEYDILSVSIYFVTNQQLFRWGIRNNRDNPIVLNIFNEDPDEELPGELIASRPDAGPANWEVVERENLRYLDGPFYVGWHMNPHARNNEYMGIDGEVDHEGVVFASIDGEWSQLDILPGDPLVRALIWSHFDEEFQMLNLSPERSLRTTSRSQQADVTDEVIQLAGDGYQQFSISDPVINWSSIRNRYITPRRDPAIGFRVYVNGEAEADIFDARMWWNHALSSEDEDHEYTYSITALYGEEQNLEEIPGNEIQATANMAPGSIRFLDVTTEGLNYTVSWLLPNLNADGTQCVDYAGCEIFVNGEQVATLGPEFLEWQDAIEEGEEGWFEITVVALDEVPNYSIPATKMVAIGNAYFFDFEQAGVEFSVAPFLTWERSRQLNGPDGAHSGIWAWGTRPDDDEYDNNANWTMTLRDEFVVQDLTAHFDFYHFMSADEGHDGGQVQISVDDGPWQLIVPADGYPDQSVAGLLNTPGYTGDTEGWEFVSFDLADADGRLIKLRWRFGTDASINWYPGWFIDDLVVWGCTKVDPVDVAGVVIDQDGVPVNGVSVSGGRDVAETDNNGIFRLTNLLPIPTTFTTRKPGYPSSQVELDLEPGIDLDIELSINRIDVSIPDGDFEFAMGPGDEGVFAAEILNQSDLPLPYRIRVVNNLNQGRDAAYSRQLRSTHIGVPRRDLGESIFTWNLSERTGFYRIQGAVYTGEKFFFSSGDPDRGNSIVELDWEGNHVDDYLQPVIPVGWGFRDLTWDGDLIYGSQDRTIVGFSQEGEIVSTQAGAPLTINRALTYDPTVDGFWAAEWGSPWYLINRDGDILYDWDDHGLERVYGFAYNPEDVDGLWLYVLADEGDGVAGLYRTNPYEEEIQRESEFEGKPAGCFITGKWDESRWVFGGVFENDGQYLQTLEIGPRMAWISTNPMGGEIGAGERQELSIEVSIPEQAAIDEVYSATILVRAFEATLASLSFTAQIVEGFQHFETPAPNQRFMEVTVESATINDMAITAGSEIAVLSPAGEVGGVARWLNLPVQFRVFSGEGALDPGDRLDFRVWDVVNNQEFITDADFVDGVDVFLTEEQTTVRLAAVIIDTQVVSLAAGWNLSSIRIRPDEYLVESILGPVHESDNLILTKDVNGAFWYPEINYNDLEEWDVLSAYLIAVEEEDEFTVIGRRVAPETEIPLQAGWNYLSYLPDFPLDPQIALADYLEFIYILKNGTGEFVIPWYDYWGMGEMKPGLGYKISVTDDIEFVYNQDDEIEERRGQAQSDFQNSPSTGSDMSLLITSISPVSRSVADEIHVITENSGLTVGRASVSAIPIGIIIRGDDLNTETIEGAIEGERLKIVIRNEKDEFFLDLKFLLGDMMYREDALGIVEIGDPIQIPTNLVIESIHPNPFNAQTQVVFSLPERSMVKIIVSDLTGRKVEEMTPVQYQPGTHKIHFSSDTWSSGIYIIEISAVNTTVSQKMILMR